MNVKNIFFSQNLVFPRSVPLGVPVRGSGWLPGTAPEIFRGYSDALGLYERKVLLSSLCHAGCSQNVVMFRDYSRVLNHLGPSGLCAVGRAF